MGTFYIVLFMAHADKTKKRLPFSLTKLGFFNNMFVNFGVLAKIGIDF